MMKLTDEALKYYDIFSNVVEEQIKEDEKMATGIEAHVAKELAEKADDAILYFDLVLEKPELGDARIMLVAQMMKNMVDISETLHAILEGEE